jgi:hypothetical protein
VWNCRSSGSARVGVGDDGVTPYRTVIPTNRWRTRSSIEEGASVNELAAEVGHTARTVRYALRRHGIPQPSEQRYAHVDWDELYADWRAGEPAAVIAERHDLSIGVVYMRTVHIPRDERVHARRTSKYARLNDPGWLRGSSLKSRSS